MNSEKLNDILKNESFMKEVLNANSPEEFKILFKSKGVDLSDEDIKEITNLVRLGMKSSIKECDLENINGGNGRSVSGRIKDAAKCALYIAVAGSIVYFAKKSGEAIDAAKDTLRATTGAVEGLTSEARDTLHATTGAVKGLTSAATDTLHATTGAVEGVTMVANAVTGKVNRAEPRGIGRWLLNF